MAEVCRARVCAVGTDKDLCNVFRAMLANLEYETEHTAGERDVAGWVEAIREAAGVGTAGEPLTANFSYGMICQEAYGDAWADECLLRVARHGCGLWTALFTYESRTPFQGHDWLMLHQKSGNVLMEAIYAEDFPGAPKGGLILSGGRAMDDWNRMNSAWLFLMTEYGGDDTLGEPGELLERLLADEADDAGWDEDEDEEDDELLLPEEEPSVQRGLDPRAFLLTETAFLLRLTAERMADQEALRRDMNEAIEKRDYPALLDCQLTLADARLWETDRVGEWMDRLKSLSKT